MLYSNTVSAKNNQLIPVFYDGKPMHSKYNPANEAEHFVASINKSDFFVIAGIGAGYHIEKLSEKFPDSLILAVENSDSELDFVRKNFTSVRILESKKNIYFSTIENFSAQLKQLYIPSVYDSINFIEHKAWAVQTPEKFSHLVDSFKKTINDISSDFSTQAHFGKLWTRNILQNLKHLNSKKSFSFPKDKTALVVAAGPSLDDFLLSNKNKLNEYYIIATDTAYKILKRNNIIPDAVFSVDGQNVSTNHFSNLTFDDSNNTIYIFELTANHSVVNKISRKTKNVIFTYSSHPLEVFAAGFSTNSLVKIDSKSGTVTIAAVDFAKNAGFSKIVIAGADFAYSNGKSYASGSYLDDLYLKNQNKTLSQETLYSQLMYRTKLININQHKYTTETLTSYRIALENWLKLNNYDSLYQDNCYQLSAKTKNNDGTIKISEFNYSSFIKKLTSLLAENIQMNKTSLQQTDFLLLPIIAYLKKNDLKISGKIKPFEQYVKLARNFILRYT